MRGFRCVLLAAATGVAVEANMGSMGFMSFKKTPGGFAAVIDEAPPPPPSTTFLLGSKKTTTTTQKKKKKKKKTPQKISSAPAKPSLAAASASSKKPTAPKKKPKKDVPTTIFNGKPNKLYQNIVMTTNAAGFALSVFLSLWPYTKDRHYHVDLIGTGAMALGALPVLLPELPAKIQNQLSGSHKLDLQRFQYTSAAVVAWSTKLALFLFLRVVENGGDPRLDAIMHHPGYCAGFWSFSAIWGIVCGLPYSVGLTSNSPGDTRWLQTGMGIFATGFLIETVADLQKYMFKHSKKAKHRGAFCKDGLWSLSQHPNWFGNWLLWTGIWVANAPALVDNAPMPKDKKTRVEKVLFKIWQWRRVALAAVGPWFLWRLFDQQATGEMLGEALEASRKKYGYGRNTEYTTYIDNTPRIIPKLF